MVDRFRAFSAQATWTNSDGTLTVSALQTLNQVVKLFGGEGNILPAVFSYAPIGGAPFGIVYLASDGSVTSTIPPTNGQILIGRTGLSPILGSPAGIANRTTVSLGVGTIIIDISAAYVGQPSITTLGTIATGTWNGDAVAVGYGGTGLTSYAIGDIVYASGTTTLAKLADVATGNVLLSGGVGVAPSYGKVTLTGHVSGTLSAANGGTGQSSYTTGDLLYASGGAALSKLADVATGQVLKSGGVGVAPAYGQVSLTADVAGVLPIANGGGLSGTYTPTLTNVANLDASTAYQCQYMRVGNVVSVSGKVDIDPTTATVSAQLGISLPIASNFGAAEDCAGTAFATGVSGQGAAILADTTNDRAQLQFIAADTTNKAMYFQFLYEII